MAKWTCPKCERQFGRANQGHTCAPGMTLKQYFADAKPWEEPIFDVVNAHFQSLDSDDTLIVDPIAMGIMFKNGPMVCELRAMKKWTAVGFSLPRKLTSKKLSRKVVQYQNVGKFFHVMNVTEPSQIDDDVLGWLTEAFFLPTEGAPPGSDPMVPDDIDDDFDLG